MKHGALFLIIKLQASDKSAFEDITVVLEVWNGNQYSHPGRNNDLLFGDLS